MDGHLRKAAYLEKAKEADQMAEKVMDDVIKSAWHQIAESYRQMAKRTP